MVPFSPLVLTRNSELISGRSSSQICCGTASFVILFLAICVPISESLMLRYLLPYQVTRPTLLLQYQGTNEDTNNNSSYNNGGEMKAWNCHGTNQKDLVDRLCQATIVRTPAVRKVMELVDRANYIPNNPYMDAPQMIGLGQTISAPHMHAHVLEELYPYLVGKHHNLKLLDVGCGSGYLTATLGRWIQPPPWDKEDHELLGTNVVVSGKVFGIDVRRDLVELTRRNIQKADADLLYSGVLTIDVGDGWKGLPSEAPFDAIHVGAAADGLPHTLVAQLKLGGVMIIPVGMEGQIQTLCKIERIALNDPLGFDPNDYRIANLLAVRYVPLVKPTDP